MQIVPHLLRAAGFVVGGSPTPALLSPPHSPDGPALTSASVRVTNNLTNTATIGANGKVLFDNVAPRQTTDWATVSDSSVVFTVKEAGEGKQPASATQTIEDGAKYTVIATSGMGGKPELSIKKEAKSTPPDSTDSR